MKPKPVLRLSITKEAPKKPALSISTPHHKYTNSLNTPKSMGKIPISTKARPSFSSFLSPNASKSILTAKHQHTASQPFPINAQSPRLIKIPKSDSSDDKLLWNGLSIPISAEKVMELFKMHLNSFEQVEILSFPDIYYVGIGVNKARNAGLKNFGFDDDEGDYKIIIGDHLAYRYEIVQALGSGSFGKVIKVYDHKENCELAVKIIKNKPRFHEQAKEEVEILNYLKLRDPDCNFSIIHLQDTFEFRGHICITFELLGMNLYQYLKANNFQGLNLITIKKYASQILQALRLMDRFKVIHCDLKPENILLKPSDSSILKVIDFGSACFFDKRVYTYIQSRFYRAPEIILGLPYTTSIDMWSFGCILVELYTGRPIFPGENEAEQISCMMEILGVPPAKIISKASRKNVFFEGDNRPKVYINSKGKRKVPSMKSLNDLLKGADEMFVHLVQQCLEWDCLKRISPDEALLHPWLLEEQPVVAKPRHSKTQSQSIIKLSRLFTIKENPLT